MQQNTGAKKDFQKQCVYWAGGTTYWIWAEGEAIRIDWQEANKLIYKKCWAAEYRQIPELQMEGNSNG